jgi:glucose/arabinose dehydrogenase
VRALGLLLVGLVLSATSASARESALHLVTIGDFASPVYATAAPGDPSSLYVVEQAGRILVVTNGRTRATPFLDIRSIVKSGGEQGLLSVAFDPSYTTNRFFYVDYTDANGDTRVVRYRSNGTSAVPTSAKQLLFVKDFAANHNGGQLQFGPDKLLYWGNGDGGGAGDPQLNGQSLARPFAKIMRTNPRVAKPFWRVVAYGLRNPWRFSFDRANGDLYIADVGQNAYEEVDYLKRGSGIANFGWNRYEGDHDYQSSTPLLARGPYHPPVVEYPHSQGCSVTGGYVYRGKDIRSAVGRYFYGDLCSGTVWSLKVVAGKARTVRVEPFKVDGVSSFAEDTNGELYVMSVTTGVLSKLVG